MSVTERPAGPPPTTATDPVQAFLDAVETGAVATCTAWAGDAVVDATVPNWRFTFAGPDAIRAEYGRWFAHPGRFEELRRLPVPDGEVVEYLLTWTEGGVPHAAHHVHLLTVRDGTIAADTVMCGGRWPASLLAEMAEAAGASAASRGPSGPLSGMTEASANGPSGITEAGRG